MKQERTRGRPPKNAPAEGLGDLWVWLREKLNKTQKEGILALLEVLGEPAGANLKRYQTLISHWERGSRTLSDERLKAVDRVLDTWVQELERRKPGKGESFSGNYFVEDRGSHTLYMNLGLRSSAAAKSNLVSSLPMVQCPKPDCGQLTPRAGRYCMHCAGELTGPRDLNVDFQPPSNAQGCDGTGGVEPTGSGQQSSAPEENTPEQDSNMPG